MRGTVLIAAILGLAGLGLGFSQEPVRMFLPVQEVDNLGKSRLLSDEAGGIHIVAPSIVGNGWVYSWCEAGCSGPEQLNEVRFETEANGPLLALDLDPQGRPHVLVGDYTQLRYAHCTADCRTRDGWSYGLLASFDQPDWTISGDTLALGPDGRAHFLLHGSTSIFRDGIHTTWYYSCAADCHLGGNWSGALIEPEQNYTNASLHVGPGGVLLAGMIAELNYDLGMENSLAAYLECRSDCHLGENWVGIGLYDAFDDSWSRDIPAAVSLQLTQQGNPRVVFLGADEANDPLLIYMECDAEQCTTDGSWSGAILLDDSGPSIGAGVHLQTDSSGGLYIGSTVGTGIVSWYCPPGADCTETGVWELNIVESSDDIEADDIFLYTNCVIGAWFLRDPQLAPLADGRLATVYTAQDYSFGGVVSEPGKPACPVGLDMSLGRLTIQRP